MSGHGSGRPRSRRIGLRGRVAISFGLLSLVIVGVLAAATWLLTSTYLHDRREATAVAQVGRDAVLVADRLGRDAPDLPALLDGLSGQSGSGVALRHAGRWLAVGSAAPWRGLPSAQVDPAAPTSAWLAVDGGPALATSAPMPGGDVLVELDPTAELRATVHFLGLLLAAATAAAAALGLGMGWWAGGRALRPVRDLSETAARVASGDLSARLPDQNDADLVSLADTFNRTASDLEARVRRDARFAGDVSHELRSPLSAMVAAIGILRHRRAEMSGVAREAVEMLDDDLRRFSTLVTDLLEISRQYEAPDERDLEIVDLGELTLAVAGEHWEEVVVDVATGAELRVLGDRRRLRQVLLNLGRNADQHGAGLVRLAVAGHPDGVRWEVDDAGPGVPAELRETIFERFDRGAGASDRRAAGGSGLGLAVVAGHVRRHGGRVSVAERPGGGTRVVVVLPATGEDDAGAPPGRRR